MNTEIWGILRNHGGAEGTMGHGDDYKLFQSFYFRHSVKID